MDKFQILETCSLRDALILIDKNHHGIIFIIDINSCVIGLATDGDIRRKLLDGASLDDQIGFCANKNFIWATQDTPRETLLKQLDQRIRVIPILNKANKLVELVSQNHLPIQLEEKIYARARAPVRISFGGGGSDLTHYFVDSAGAVINATISLYSHATLRKRADNKVLIYSRDIGSAISADNLEEILLKGGEFGLIQALLRVVRPDFGFELFLHSDFPMKSGLGGSAVVSAAVLGCFNQFRIDKWDSHEIAELAYQAERLYFGIAGGWQDQYATVFGGFNFMEFRMDQNVVHPLRIPSDVLHELEESLILCDTGISHESGEIHNDQKQQIEQDHIRKIIESNVGLTYQIRNHLLRGKLTQFGRSLNEAWLFKRQFSSKISSIRLDQIYEDAIEHGAIGGKLLGAGGGGFFLFYVLPFRKYELIEALEARGLAIKSFRFEQDGLRAWSVRESRHLQEIHSI